jgi:hypothetical protein
LLFARDDFHNVIRLDCLARGQEPSQYLVDEVKSFVLGRIQQLQILLDGGGFRRGFCELVVRHSEPRGGVQVVHVFVVDERTRLADQ